MLVTTYYIYLRLNKFTVAQSKHDSKQTEKRQSRRLLDTRNAIKILQVGAYTKWLKSDLLTKWLNLATELKSLQTM